MVLLDEVLMRARPADQLARALADGRMTASDDGATVADTGFDADIVGAALDALEQALIRAEHRADRAEAALRLAIERAAHAEALLSVAVPR